MSVEAMVQKMIDDLTAALVDATKHDKGNNAAGTRVRRLLLFTRGPGLAQNAGCTFEPA